MSRTNSIDLNFAPVEPEDSYEDAATTNARNLAPTSEPGRRRA